MKGSKMITMERYVEGKKTEVWANLCGLLAVAAVIAGIVYVPGCTRDSNRAANTKRISENYKDGAVLISKETESSVSGWDSRCFLLDTDGNTNTPEIAVVQEYSDRGRNVLGDTLYKQAIPGQRDSIENWANRLHGRQAAKVVVLNEKTR